MKDIDEVRSRVSNRKKNRDYYERNVLGEQQFSFINRYVTKIMMLFIAVLSIAVYQKSNPNENVLHAMVNYEMNYFEARSFVVNNIGNILPFDLLGDKSIPVSGNNRYEKVADNLYINNSQTAIALRGGIILYVGVDEIYGEVVRIQFDNGVTATYGFLSDVKVGMYDRIENGQLIGNYVNHLYISFESDGKILTYEQALGR